MDLPRGLLDARNIALQCFLPETDAAEIEITHERARTTALEAAPDCARRKLRFALRFYDH